MKAIVNNSCCQILYREKLPRKTVGKTMEVEFSANWEGLAITAVFEAGDVKKDVVYTGEPIIIPHEVLVTEGLSVMLGFHGALPDGTIVKRTVPEWLNNVSASLDPSGETSSEPTPDWAAQVQAIALEAKEVANSVRNDADEGKFNGGQGPQGPAGATGPKGDTGAAGEAGGYYTPAVTQPDENTLRVAFTPSKEDMPAVADTDITLPAGGGGGGSGEDGGYYAPSVDDEGNLTWTASKTDMPAVDGANIKGPKGDAGATGATGPKGETGATGAQGPQGPAGDAGADGKSAYAYAVEGGYTGTEVEFAAKLAQEKFANPYALTFTGAVTGSYDGSEAVTVEIPSGGGGGFEVLVDFTTEEAVTEFTIPKTVIGPLASKIQEASMLIMQICVPRDTTDTSITTNGTISIKAYIGWLEDIAGGAFNCIIAPSETYNSTYTKNVLFTKVPKTARTNDNQACLVNIWGGKNNENADAAVTRTVINHLNRFYSDSYLTIVGSQTMAAGTRFMMGVIA